MTDVENARTSLIRLLRGACSGELAAGYAYRGHWKSLPVGAPERERIREIEAEEWHHRELVLRLLGQLGTGPSRARETVFWWIGKTIGLLCHLGGWFIPMYGAGKLERSNIVEYEHAAQHAGAAGHADMIDCLLMMAEVEWEHELFFREQILGHRLLRLFPLWDAPPPKATIRQPLDSASHQSAGIPPPGPPASARHTLGPTGAAEGASVRASGDLR